MVNAVNKIVLVEVGMTGQDDVYAPSLQDPGGQRFDPEILAVPPRAIRRLVQHDQFPEPIRAGQVAVCKSVLRCSWGEREL